MARTPIEKLLLLGEKFPAQQDETQAIIRAIGFNLPRMHLVNFQIFERFQFKKASKSKKTSIVKYFHKNLATRYKMAAVS